MASHCIRSRSWPPSRVYRSRAAGTVASSATGQITAAATAGKGWLASASVTPAPSAARYPSPAAPCRARLPRRPLGAASAKCTEAAMTSGPATVATARASWCAPAGGWLASRAAVRAIAPASAPPASGHGAAWPADCRLVQTAAATAQARVSTKATVTTAGRPPGTCVRSPAAATTTVATGASTPVTSRAAVRPRGRPPPAAAAVRTSAASSPVPDGPVADGPVADDPVVDGSVADGPVVDGLVAEGMVSLTMVSVPQ